MRGVSLLPSASVSFVTLHEGTRGYNNPLLESRTDRRLSPDSLVLSDQMIPGSEVSKSFHGTFSANKLMLIWERNIWKQASSPA